MWIFLKPKKLKTILSIAGSDPVGGAGIQADIRAGNFAGVHVMTALTAVTSQNSKSVSDLGIVNAENLKKQLYAILAEVIPDAVKIGMIGSMENAKVIWNVLSELSYKIPIVIDPVLKSTVGDTALSKDKGMTSFYIDQLFPLSTIVTPNLEELKMLGVKDIMDTENISGLPMSLNTNAVILTGIKDQKENIRDILYMKDQAPIIQIHPVLDHQNLHGTGCAFSTLLASNLALGFSIEDSFKNASSAINSIISKSSDYELGSSTYGPLNIINYNL